MNTPWAVLLCNFNDNTAEAFDRAFYERLFTAAGTGSNNMVDYFLDMTHGRIDCSGSAVFGPFTVPHARHEYTDLFSSMGFAVRPLSMGWARQAAMDAGVDLSAYPYTIVCWNVPTDLWGGGGRYAACDNLSMQPTVLGQEMSHGYGLLHARAEGMGDADYTDPWDVMSSRASYAADDPVWGPSSIGPGLNAWEMRYQLWLDESRVFSGSSGTVQLRPLHRRDLPGYLAADLGGVLAEFRVPERWDAAIPEPTVLLHSFGYGSDDHLFHSYLALGPHGPSAPDSYEFGAGDTLSPGWGTVTHVPPMLWVSQAQLVEIDAANLTATIDVTRSTAPLVIQNVLEELRLDSLGLRRETGAAIIVDGGVVRVPEWDPTLPLVRQICALRASEDIADPALRSKVRESTFRAIAAMAAGAVDGAQSTSQPAPKPISDLPTKGLQ
jgi:hypothetical protein